MLMAADVVDVCPKAEPILNRLEDEFRAMGRPSARARVLSLLDSHG